MRSRKLDLSVLFYNDHFVPTSSVLTVIVLWLVMVTVSTQERPRIIYGVPATVRLSETNQEQGPKVFEQGARTAKAPIRDDSIVINRIKPENTQVVATLVSSITQPDSYPLPLMTQRVGSLADHEIVSVEPSTIITSVDVYKKVTFPIQNGITYKTDPNYFVNAPSFSSSTAVTSGPEKEIVKTKKVSAEYDVKETLTQSKNFTTDLVLYDAYGEKPSTDKLGMSVKPMDVNIMVLARKVMKLSPTSTGKPVELVLSFAVRKVDPEAVEVAGSENVSTSMNELSLEAIDFSKFSANNQNLQIDITLPPGCKNLSSIYTASVTLDFSGFKSKKISVTDFQAKDLTASKSAQVFTKSLTMTLTDLAKQVGTTTAADAYAQIDMTGKESFIGHSEFSVILVARSHTSVWAYGEYKASVNVTEKNGWPTDDPILTDERDAISRPSLW